jgi:hypothetical protein
MRRLALACLVLLAVAAATAPTSAPAHPFRGTIVPPPPPGGPEPFKDACGVAVDGDKLFASNYYDRSVYVFELDEGWQFRTRIPVPQQFTPPAARPINGPCDLALDSAGNLYVNNWHRDVVRFPVSGPGFGTPEVVDLGPATGIAVDPATDNLLVNRRTHVAEYAVPVSAGASPIRSIGTGSVEDGYGVAVSAFPGDALFPDTSGWVYVADAADATVEVFDPSVSLTVPIEVIDGQGTPQAGFNHLADTDLAVDPADGHLYVVDNLQPGFEMPEAVVDEFSPLGHYRGPIPAEFAGGAKSLIIHAEPTSLAIAGSDFFVSSGNYFFDNTVVGDAFHQDGAVRLYGPAPKATAEILTATKSGTGAGTVFSSDPAGLRCGTACEGEFDQGRLVTLLASPAPHNRLVAWTGCETETSGGACRVRMSSDRTVDAEFEPIPQQPLAVTVGGAGSVLSAPAGIGCGGGTCGAEFDQGSVVTLSASPAAGSALAGWSGCDSEPAPGACAVTMTAPRAVAAQFAPLPVPPPPAPPAPPRRTLSVSSTALGTASGVVVSDPGGIDCGSSCAGVYGDGATVTLTARPAAGSAFVGWGGCDRSDGTRCTVTLGDDRTVVAAFGPGSPGPLRLRGLAVKGATASLRVEVPVAGDLTASSPRTVPASALPIEPGVVTLRLELNAAGARALARAERYRLAVPVALALAPFDGGDAVSARRTVVFGTAAKPRGKAQGGDGKAQGDGKRKDKRRNLPAAQGKDRR